MRVLIVGAGAVGSVVAAGLSAAGESVTLLGREAQAVEIRHRGLQFEGEATALRPSEAVSHLAEGSRFDAVLLAVKTFDLAGACRLVGATVSPTPVLLLENGLGVERDALSGLRAGGWPHPERSVVRAVQSIPATYLRPGVVRRAGTGEVILPVPSTAGAADGAVPIFSALFRASGLRLRHSSELRREIWRKLLVNAAINPLTALHRVLNGELRHPPLRRAATVLLAEARAVAAVCGERFSQGESEGELSRVLDASSGNRSSMLQDVERGRPTEVEAICGELARLGWRAGLPTPTTRGVLMRLRALTASARPQLL